MLKLSKLQIFSIILLFVLNKFCLANTIKITASDLTIPAELQGQISPLDTYNISAPTNAQISEIYVTPGDKVKKDQKLLLLKSDQLDIDIRNAKEYLIRAQMDYDKKKSWQYGDEVFQAKQSDIKNKFTADRALELYKQNQLLYKQGIISNNELEQSKISYDDAKLNLELSKRHLKQIITQGDATQLNLAKLALDNAQARLDIFKNIQNKLLVLSPSDGIILKANNNNKSVEKSTNSTNINFIPIGYNATTGENLLAIGDLQGFKVIVTANEQIIQNIKLNQQVEISIPALYNKNTKFIGKVTAIDAQPNNTDNQQPPKYNVIITSAADSKSTTATASNNLQQRNIFLGMTAKVQLNIIEKPNTILVPFSNIAYDYDQKKSYVMKLNKNNTPEKSYIELGNTTLDKIEVVSGLSVNDVITSIS